MLDRKAVVTVGSAMIALIVFGFVIGLPYRLLSISVLCLIAVVHIVVIFIVALLASHPLKLVVYTFSYPLSGCLLGQIVNTNLSDKFSQPILLPVTIIGVAVIIPILVYLFHQVDQIDQGN